MSLAQNWLLTAVSTPPEKIKEEIEMSDDLVIAGDEFHARDLEQAAVIRNPFPYYDMLRDKPL